LEELMNDTEKRVLLNQEQIASLLRQIASRISDKYPDMKDVVLVGIRTGGAYLAHRLREIFKDRGFGDIPTGILDITLYRDDWTRISHMPQVRSTKIPFSVDDKIVILVDDVLYTGRTVRAAMDAIIDLGRPRKIELAILADRGDGARELPIKANYVGGTWDVSEEELINVYLREEGAEEDCVVIEKRQKGG